MADLRFEYKDSEESLQQSSLRTQVWDRLQRTGYANLATELTVSRIMEMLSNDTMETEERLGALLGIKSEPKDIDVKDSCNPLDERFHVEIDVDQTTINCVELPQMPEISENDTKDNCFEKPSTSKNLPDNGYDTDGREKMLRKVHTGGKNAKELRFQTGLESCKKNIFGKIGGPTGGKTCKNKFAARINILSHTRKKPYKYKSLTCGKAFARSSTLHNHSKTLTGENPYDKTFDHSPYKCLPCGKVFALSSSLRRHSKTHSGEKPYQCLTCGKAFARNSSLHLHIKTHTGEKPHQCLTCGKAFIQRSNLRVHLKTHSGDWPHQGPTCGKTCNQSSTLCNHSKTHSGEKPYQCLTCRKTFAHSSSLHRHSRIHSGEKPYQCLTCGKTCNQSSTLCNHSKTHSREKPYQCLNCGKAFASRSGLYGHSKTHSGEKHTCVTCGKSFTHERNLNRHSKIHYSKQRKHNCLQFCMNPQNPILGESNIIISTGVKRQGKNEVLQKNKK